MVLYVLYAFTAPIAVKRIPKIAIGGNIEPAIIVQKIPKQTTKIPMSIAARGDWGSLLLLFLCMEDTSLKVDFMFLNGVIHLPILKGCPPGILFCGGSKAPALL